MYIQPCTDDQWRAIYNKFNMTEESLQNDVRYLMDWMEKQPHLPNVKDKDFLRSRLLHCKNRIEKVKETLETYYIKKAIMPEIFTNLDAYSAEFETSYALSRSIPMPRLMPDGDRVFIYQVNYKDGIPLPSVDDFLRSLILTSLVLAKLEFCKSMVTIVDCQNFSLPFINLFFWSMKKLWTTLAKAFPSRHRRLYILNASAAIDPLLYLAKKVMKEDVGDRVVVWRKKPEDLAEVIPKDFLPSDFGGNERSINELAELWLEEIKRQNEWLKWEAQYKADISNQQQENCDSANSDLGEFGTDGTFRQINVD